MSWLSNLGCWCKALSLCTVFSWFLVLYLPELSCISLIVRKIRELQAWPGPRRWCHPSPWCLARLELSLLGIKLKDKVFFRNNIDIIITVLHVHWNKAGKYTKMKTTPTLFINIFYKMEIYAYLFIAFLLKMTFPISLNISL